MAVGLLVPEGQRYRYGVIHKRSDVYTLKPKQGGWHFVNNILYVFP